MPGATDGRRLGAQFCESGRIRMNAGVNPTMFKWHLPSNESFETPEAVLVYSANGLEHMTHTFHELYQRFLIPEAWYKTVPPVLINTWESMYFDVSHAKVLDLAKAAAGVGVEMIVLDDGWFGGRDDATSSLGDWHVNLKKFPEGLAGLVRDVNALGLKFGIWVEPEMVNVNSDLYKKNPNWTLNQQGRRFRCEGRFQLVLDFTLQAVRDHICGSAPRLLSLRLAPLPLPHCFSLSRALHRTGCRGAARGSNGWRGGVGEQQAERPAIGRKHRIYQVGHEPASHRGRRGTVTVQGCWGER